MIKVLENGWVVSTTKPLYAQFETAVSYGDLGMEVIEYHPDIATAKRRHEEICQMSYEQIRILVDLARKNWKEN